MARASSKEEDICIKLNDKCIYDVSKFLRKYDAKAISRKRLETFNEFTQLLDAKTYIDTNDPGYSHIYQGIDTLVNRVVEELIKLDPYFTHVKLRRTGSSTSGVKVGLPHESDYVLELPKDKQLRSGESFDRNTLFPLVHKIATKRSPELTAGLPNWVIHVTKRYNEIGGICLVMECRACANNPASERVGVTVDLVPAYIVETTDESLNEKAASYLPYSLDTYAQKEELYRLLHNDDCDTGFIENCIMTQLPEGIKQSYRVAKYLFSNLNTSHIISYENIKTLNEETRLRLYGRKPYLSSYTIRVLFLHLILDMPGTKAEQRLKGGLLVLCLLDMVDQCMKSFRGERFGNGLLKHPLIGNRLERLYPYYSKQSIDDVIYRLETETPANVVEQFHLLNDRAYSQSHPSSSLRHA